MSISILEFTERERESYMYLTFYHVSANKRALKNVIVNKVHDHKENIMYEYLYVSI